MAMDPEFLINKAKSVKDPFESKALILMAKTLYPGNFNIQVCLVLSLNTLGSNLKSKISIISV